MINLPERSMEKPEAIGLTDTPSTACRASYGVEYQKGDLGYTLHFGRYFSKNLRWCKTL